MGRRPLVLFLFTCREHIFNKYGVAAGGVVDEDVGDGADYLAVPDYGRAAHESVNIWAYE